MPCDATELPTPSDEYSERCEETDETSSAMHRLLFSTIVYPRHQPAGQGAHVEGSEGAIVEATGYY